MFIVNLNEKGTALFLQEEIQIEQKSKVKSIGIFKSLNHCSTLKGGKRLEKL